MLQELKPRSELPSHYDGHDGMYDDWDKLVEVKINEIIQALNLLAAKLGVEITGGSNESFNL